MDIRAPRANRGAGFKSQGCYRPDAVSARPMGHLLCRSLSISSRTCSSSLNSRTFDQACVVANQPPPSRPPTPSSGPRRRPAHEGRSVASSRRLRKRGSRIKFTIAGPDRPNDPPKFIGHCDRGFVVTSSRLHRERPLMKPCQWLMGSRATIRGVEHGASTVRARPGFGHRLSVHPPAANAKAAANVSHSRRG